MYATTNKGAHISAVFPFLNTEFTQAYHSVLINIGDRTFHLKKASRRCFTNGDKAYSRDKVYRIFPTVTTTLLNKLHMFLPITKEWH